MRLRARLGVSVCLTIFFIVSIILVLPGSKAAMQLHRIALGTPWDWESDIDNGTEVGTRLVVFGDSWVDNAVQAGEEGKGREWTEALCYEINCTSYLNFGATQSSKSYPAPPPTGALTSNLVLRPAYSMSFRSKKPSNLLPDLAAQIAEFLALPTRSKFAETIFVVSFGLWDVYQFAALDFASTSQMMINATITELFVQLDNLHSQCSKSSESSKDEDTALNSSTFRVIIPRLFDPTLLPGWLSQRPIPLHPSSVAEEQKNGMYLTALWNSMLENKLGEWVQEPAATSVNIETGNKEPTFPAQTTQNQGLEKDIYYYDLPQYLLDLIIEHQFEEEGLLDATGLGTSESPFESVYLPCVREAKIDADDGYVDLKGQMVCKEPEEYLFWDGFRLGAVANEGIAKQVAEMMKAGGATRKIRGEGKSK